MSDLEIRVSNARIRLGLETLQDFGLTRAITIGQHELALHAVESLGVVDVFEHEIRDSVLESLRTTTISLLNGREADVRVVIVRVQVLAVPAGGESEFEAKTILAVGSHELLRRHEVTTKSVLVADLGVIVKAIEAD